MSEVLSLGGRFFSPVEAEPTFEHEEHLMWLLSESGVHAEISAGGDVVAAVLRSRRTIDFLAAALVPAGQAWSPEVAAETARHIKSLTSPDEKALLRQTLEGLLTGFFLGATRSATPSSATSPTASETETTAEPRERPLRRRRPAPAAVDSGAA